MGSLPKIGIVAFPLPIQGSITSILHLVILMLRSKDSRSLKNKIHVLYLSAIELIKIVKVFRRCIPESCRSTNFNVLKFLFLFWDLWPNIFPNSNHRFVS